MKETILVVDDEVKIIEVIKLYLENEGYTVIQAESGIEALKSKGNLILTCINIRFNVARYIR